jgi:hypothetical protein
MSYPEQALKLAAALLEGYELEHAVMTLKLQSSLQGGCCGMVGPSYDLARALGCLAGELESCGDKATALAALSKLRHEQL